jgi:hypothetical protein
MKKLWCVALVIVCAAADVRAVNPYIDFGPADPFAVGQPYVAFGLAPVAGGSPDGPEAVLINNLALVDTAAQGIVIAAPAYLEKSGPLDLVGTPNPNLYDVQTRADTSTVQYAEQGVAGSENLDLFAPYYLQYYETDGTAHETPTTIRAIGDDDVQLSYFGGIIGTAVLEGQVTVFGNQTLIDNQTFYYGPDSGFSTIPVPHVSVKFRDDLPSNNGHAYRLCLEKIVIEPTGFEQPTDPDNGWVPSFGNLYAVPDVRSSVGTDLASGAWVVDSGAQLSIISSDTATAMGIDPGAATDFIQVGGLGGETELVPVVAVDELRLPTKQGVDLVVHDIEVAVIDIPGLDIGGILGMNILSTGYLAPALENLLGADGLGDINDFLFEDSSGPDVSDITQFGAFLTATFDLRDIDSAELILEVNPDLHQVAPEPTSAALMLVGVALLRRRRRQASAG